MDDKAKYYQECDILLERVSAEYTNLIERFLDDHNVAPTQVQHFDVKAARDTKDETFVAVLSVVRRRGLKPLRLVFRDTDVKALRAACADAENTLGVVDDLLEWIDVE
jgi:hypothetical protein